MAIRLLTHLLTYLLTGACIDQLLTPWDGYPLASLYSTIRVRCLVAWPIAIILWTLCLMHALHKGADKGLRIIGRRKRLICRALAGLVIAALPFLVYADPT